MTSRNLKFDHKVAFLSGTIIMGTAAAAVYMNKYMRYMLQATIRNQANQHYCEHTCEDEEEQEI